MRKIGFFLIFVLAVFSCQRNLEKPKELLSKSEMADIMADLYLYRQMPLNAPLKPINSFDTYVSVFKKHKTTKEIFQQSFDFYYVDTDAMENIYDKAIDNLKDKLSKEQRKKLEEDKELLEK
ncbi:MAG: DUF4296 domain-containing protein [Flavobacteriaceae bacterium]|jgi:hypothetical protein|nr:DUF4296 domain-containing protein [Flavobacteriaceae bacterium]